MDPRLVAVAVNEKSCYPERSPFHPGIPYPEYAFGEVDSAGNSAYALVREAFRLAGLDAVRFDSPAWNPLGELIRPGETVLLKPNLVKESHPRDPDGWRYVLTHGSMIRAAADYVWKALDGRGTVLLADAPQTDSSFSRIHEILGLGNIQKFYRRQGFDFRIADLRKEEWTNRDGVIVQRRQLPGDPAGYVAFDLGENSEFRGHGGEGCYYGADYDAGQLNRHHSRGKHEYLVARSAIQADVVLNLPKLKTHKKAGITASLKNLVGINGDKNWLPHHTEPGRHTIGDERPNGSFRGGFERSAAYGLRQFALQSPAVGNCLHRIAHALGRSVFGGAEDVVRSGNWWGNDTIWRTCLDLNKLLLYGSPGGELRPPAIASRKRHFELVDGILAGQGRGPMNPDPLAAGMVLFGVNAPSVDAACAWLMGFDPERIPIVRRAFACLSYPLADWGWRDIRIASNRRPWNGNIEAVDETYFATPHFGWKGHIERHARHDFCIPKAACLVAERGL